MFLAYMFISFEVFWGKNLRMKMIFAYVLKEIICTIAACRSSSKCIFVHMVPFYFTVKTCGQNLDGQIGGIFVISHQKVYGRYCSVMQLSMKLLNCPYVSWSAIFWPFSMILCVRPSPITNVKLIVYLCNINN